MIDSTTAPLGFDCCALGAYRRLLQHNRPKGDRPRIWVTRPFNRLPATFGNGTMICFDAPSRKAVDEFHAAALDNGGYDEGKPGIRSVEDGFFPNYYAAFVRDPTGNKLSAGCDKPE